MSAPDSPAPASLSREALHARIWDTPVTKLAVELGISGPTLVKRCQKLDIPLPPRGYWAKQTAGQKQKIVPLPPSPEARVAQALKEPVAESIAPGRTPHPIPALLLQTLQKAKPDADKRRSIHRAGLPQVTVSEAMVEPVVEALEIILVETEKRGVVFRKSRSDYGSSYFEKGSDKIALTVEEPMEVLHADAGGKTIGQATWSGSRYAQKPAGRLKFTLSKADYGDRFGDKTLTTDADHDHRQIAAQVVVAICEHFQKREKIRVQKQCEEREREARQAEWKRKSDEEERLRRERARLEKHRAELDRIAAERAFNLVKMAEWHRIAESTVAYIDHLVSTWENAQSGSLTPAQENWRDWALAAVAALPGRDAAYPDAADGPFDPDSIPLDGPYPTCRELHRPPTMPAIPAPEKSSYAPYTPPPAPYPFWLKHRHR